MKKLFTIQANHIATSSWCPARCVYALACLVCYMFAYCLRNAIRIPFSLRLTDRVCVCVCVSFVLVCALLSLSLSLFLYFHFFVAVLEYIFAIYLTVSYHDSSFCSCNVLCLANVGPVTRGGLLLSLQSSTSPLLLLSLAGIFRFDFAP